MKKLFVLFIAMSLVSNVWAGGGLWLGNLEYDNYWATAESWELGLPTSADQCYVYGNNTADANGPIIRAGDAATGKRLVLGDDTHGTTPVSASMTGGTFNSNILIGWDPCAATQQWISGGGGKFNLYDGVLTAGNFFVGWGSNAEFNQYGGTASAAALFLDYQWQIYWPELAKYNLYDGVLDITTTFAMGPTSWVNIEKGIMTISGDKTADIAWYLAAGWIKGYNGAVLPKYDYDITTPGKTTVWASGEGDLNLDYVVDFNDMSIFSQKWMQTGMTGLKDYFPRGFQDGISPELEMPRAVTAPVIDGLLASGEWNGAMAIEIVSPDCYTSPKAATMWGIPDLEAWPATPEDFSVTWYFKWDTNNLYFAASVNDNTPSYISRKSAVQVPGGVGNPSGYALQDCMQVAFDLGMTGASTWYDVTAQTPDDLGQADIYRQGAAYNFTTSEREAIAVEGSMSADGYTVEVAIPWSIVDNVDGDYVPQVNDTHDLLLANINRADNYTLLNAILAFGDWSSPSRTVTLVESNTQHSNWPWGTGTSAYYPVNTRADLYKELPPNDIVDFMDFAIFASHWMEVK